MVLFGKEIPDEVVRNNERRIMASMKKQHFVPQFYLRNFSNGGRGKAIDLYNIQSKVFRSEAKLKTQAYRDYFYGKDNETEKALGVIESEAASVIRCVLGKEEPPRRYTKEHLALMLFTIFQRERTLSAAREKNEIFGDFMNELYALEKGIDPKSMIARLKYKEPSRVSLSVAAKMQFIAWDLAYKLIVNKTDTPFITSDNPVVLYNQYLEQRKKYGSNTGYASKGLEIFIPISPKISIMFYDESVYKVGYRKRSTVEVYNENDVKALNSLQYLNAEENVYFTEDVQRSYIDGLDGSLAKFKKMEKSNLDKYYGPTDEEGNHLLFHIYGNDIRAKIDLSFVGTLKKATRYVLGAKAVHVRDEYLCQSLDEFIKKVDRGKYKVTDFWKYMYDKTAG